MPDVVDDEFVCCSFDLVTEYLKIRVSYIWGKAKDQRAVNDFSIGTWSRYVQRSSIEKWGTEVDKALLPALTSQNQAHKTLRTFVINQEDWADERRGVNKVAWKTNVRWTVGEEDAAAFEDAFDGVE